MANKYEATWGMHPSEVKEGTLTRRPLLKRVIESCHQITGLNEVIDKIRHEGTVTGRPQRIPVSVSRFPGQQFEVAVSRTKDTTAFLARVALLDAPIPPFTYKIETGETGQRINMLNRGQLLRGFPQSECYTYAIDPTHLAGVTDLLESAGVAATLEANMWMATT